MRARFSRRGHSMLYGSAVDALFTTLCTAAASGSDSMSRRERAAALRGSTFAAVDELKRGGFSSTEVLYAIEALAARAGLYELTETVDDLTAWSVQRYYDRKRQDPPRGSDATAS